MSVLHSRIIAQGGQSAAGAAGNHPFGTGNSVLVMPSSVIIHYNPAAGIGFYQDVYPSQPATADPNHAPVATLTSGHFPGTIPAGHP